MNLQDIITELNLDVLTTPKEFQSSRPFKCLCS